MEAIACLIVRSAYKKTRRHHWNLEIRFFEFPNFAVLGTSGLLKCSP